MDWALVLDVLSGGDDRRRAQCEARARALGPDALLDAPGLDRALKTLPGMAQPSAVLYVYVAVRHRLLELGCTDPRLADYLGALVLEFGDRDRAFRPAPHDDATYHYLVDLVADCERTPARRGFLLRAHLGNFSLWLAGLFPDWIAERSQRRGGPALAYYEALGARGYRLASDHELARQYALDDVFAAAADTFPRLRVALNRLSDDALFPSVHSPERLLRQVADEAQYPRADA
jgi:hypothetical protein